MISVADEIQAEKTELADRLLEALIAAQLDATYENVNYLLLLAHRAYPRIGVAEKYRISNG